MGCYDTVMVPCPTCGNREPFQTKSGECTLREYDLEKAPEDVLWDVNRHAPYGCSVCGAQFWVVGTPPVNYGTEKSGVASDLWTEEKDLDGPRQG